MELIGKDSLICILEYLNTHDLYSISRVCKYMYIHANPILDSIFYRINNRVTMTSITHENSVIDVSVCTPYRYNYSIEGPLTIRIENSIVVIPISSGRMVNKFVESSDITIGVENLKIRRITITYQNVLVYKVRYDEPGFIDGFEMFYFTEKSFRVMVSRFIEKGTVLLCSINLNENILSDYKRYHIETPQFDIILNDFEDIVHKYILQNRLVLDESMSILKKLNLNNLPIYLRRDTSKCLV